MKVLNINAKEDKMAKKDFNLKGFLVENNLTRVSKDRKKLLNEGHYRDYQDFDRRTRHLDTRGGDGHGETPLWQIEVYGDSSYSVHDGNRDRFEKEFTDGYDPDFLRSDIELKEGDYCVYPGGDIEGNSGKGYGFEPCEAASMTLNEGEGQDFDPKYWNSAEEKQESLEDVKSEGFSYDNPVEDVYIPDYSDPSGQNDQSVEMERCPKCGNSIENCLSTKDGKCVYCPECGDYFNTEDYYEWMCGEADYEEGMRDDYNDRD